MPAGSSVLDVATGGGAVLALGAEAAKGTGLHLIGIDLAASAPAESEFMAYRGGVDAASLPFGDQSFDAVTSQFGIEYAGFETALDEALRVCRGGIKMLVHAAEGVVVRQNLLQAEQVDWILDDLRLPAILEDHFRSPSNASANLVDELLGRIRTRGEADENVTLLESIHSAALALQQLWQKAGFAPCQSALTELSGQLALHRDRMRLLGGASISFERVVAAADRLPARGFGRAAIDEERFGQSRHLVGYWLTAERTNEEEV